MRSLKGNPRKLTQPRKDLIIILALSVVLVGLVFIFHPLDKIVKALGQSDELIWLAVFWLFAFPAFYFFRELKRSRQEKMVMESIVKAKSDFLANMGHELRAPFNSILGFSEMLLNEYQGKINEKQKEYLNNIYTSGKHLLQLINKLLDLVELESGEMEMEWGKFSLKDALDDCLSLLKEMAFKHNIKLSLEILPEAQIEIEADQLKFKRLVLDLLANAIKFTPSGGSACIRAKTNKEQEELEVSVQDTGIGIKLEDMSKLFKGFPQLKNPSTKTHEGVGMGLVIAKRLVELWGGRIWLESEFGKGTKVSFTVPLKPIKKS